MNGPSPAIPEGRHSDDDIENEHPQAEEDAEDSEKLYYRQVAANVERNEEDQRPVERIHGRE